MKGLQSILREGREMKKKGADYFGSGLFWLDFTLFLPHIPIKQTVKEFVCPIPKRMKRICREPEEAKKNAVDRFALQSSSHL